MPRRGEKGPLRIRRLAKGERASAPRGRKGGLFRSKRGKRVPFFRQGKKRKKGRRSPSVRREKGSLGVLARGRKKGKPAGRPRVQESAQRPSVMEKGGRLDVWVQRRFAKKGLRLPRHLSRGKKDPREERPNTSTGSKEKGKKRGQRQ